MRGAFCLAALSVNTRFVVEIEQHVSALQMMSQNEGASASDDGLAAQDAQRFCDVVIVDLNNREIPLKVSTLTFNRANALCLSGPGVFRARQLSPNLLI